MKAFKTPLQKLAERENISIMEAQNRLIAMPPDEQDELHEREIATYCNAVREIADSLADPEERSFLKKVAGMLGMEASRAQSGARAYHKLLDRMHQQAGQP